jgi:phosphoserine phosphatase
MEMHRGRGDLIILISSSPREIVEPLAAALGADGFASTIAEVRDGVYTGGITRLMHGTEKADAVRDFATRLGLDLEKCSAYGDAGGDAHMLELVGNPFCVNPDRTLLATARLRGWNVLTFGVARPKMRGSRDDASRSVRLVSMIRGLSERSLH